MLGCPAAREEEEGCRGIWERADSTGGRQGALEGKSQHRLGWGRPLSSSSHRLCPVTDFLTGISCTCCHRVATETRNEEKPRETPGLLLLTFIPPLTGNYSRLVRVTTAGKTSFVKLLTVNHGLDCLGRVASDLQLKKPETPRAGEGKAHLTG